LDPALQLQDTSGTPASASDASEMTASKYSSKIGTSARPAVWLLAAALGLPLAGCGTDYFTQIYQRGYVYQEGSLEQIPIGASQEQVLIVLGTPSTVATVSGEAFYYITQRAEQAVAFVNPKVTNQRVVAVYFDKNRRVERLANYALKDGKIFDFVSRTTPTSGAELNYLGYLFAITKPLGT
jgi:outer membrane protein assembly factor BamE (lipoprotein component of BamABCDE complex)